MGINPVYLKDAVGKSGESFELGFSGPSDAIRLDFADDRVAVVMPMRL